MYLGSKSLVSIIDNFTSSDDVATSETHNEHYLEFRAYTIFAGYCLNCQASRNNDSTRAIFVYELKICTPAYTHYVGQQNDTNYHSEP